MFYEYLYTPKSASIAFSYSVLELDKKRSSGKRVINSSLSKFEYQQETQLHKMLVDRLYHEQFEMQLIVYVFM